MFGPQVVEVMTPVFDANAWVGLHEGLISRWCRRSVCKEEATEHSSSPPHAERPSQAGARPGCMD